MTAKQSTITLAEYQQLSQMLDTDQWPQRLGDHTVSRATAVKLMDEFENDANTAFDLASEE